MTGKKIVNREYKDRLFKLVFREKKDLLELYNAINDTNYDNPDDIEINTIEDVVYMGMKNDVSFLITNVLNLYEHQSTFNPNLPLRGLLYFADLYRKLLGGRSEIYSSRRISLPYPQFVVFYNGTKEEPERQVLQLWDSYPEWSDKENASIQCKAVVLNVNLGYNSTIMNKCRKLKEYAQFIACVREQFASGRAIEESIDMAVELCIEQGVLEEMLRKHREEVCSVLLTEYDEAAHIKCEREIALEEGVEIGRAEGERIGQEIAQIALVRKKYMKHVPPEDAAEMLELPVAYVRQVMEILKKDSDIADEIIVDLLGK